MSAETERDIADQEDGMLPEYDFRGGVRGRYAERYARGISVVVHDSDAAEVLQDSDAVKRAVRAHAKNQSGEAGS